MNRWSLSALLVFLWPLSAQAVYKCTGAGGKVTLQDAPCASSEAGTKLNVPAPAPTTSRARSPYAADIARHKAEENEQQRQADAETAIHQKKVFVGMREDEVIRALGRPERVNRDSHSRSDQWVYRRGTVGGFYVYMDNGVVRSWQGDDGIKR